MAPDTTTKTVRSILCGKGYWTPDTLGQSKLRFCEDGRGELWCTGEISVWVCSETTWTVARPEQLDEVYDVNSDQQVVEFEIRLTLGEKPPASILDGDDSTPRPELASVNEDHLTPEAFSSTNTYKVRLSTGRFANPWRFTELRILKENDLLEDGEEADELARIDSETPKYSLRLSFDKSPFPQREHWKTSARSGPESMKLWDDVEFVNPEWTVLA